MPLLKLKKQVVKNKKKKLLYTIFNIYKNKFKIKSGSYIIYMPLLKLKK